MAAPIELTTTGIRRVATSIETTFAECGVRIEPGSDLAHMLGELRWAGQFAGLFTDAVVADKERTLGAVLLAEQMTHIERAVSAAGEIGGQSRAKLQHLRRNPLNLLRVVSGHGLETFFELETAQRLLRPFWNVSFEEPDIVLESPQMERIGITCKRPRKRRAVSKNIRKAAGQIDRSGLPGYIVLSVEGCVRPYLRSIDTQEDLGHQAQQVLQDMLMQDAPSIARELQSANVGGVLFCGRFLGMARKPSALCWTFRTAIVGNHVLPGAWDVLRMINKVLLGDLAAP